MFTLARRLRAAATLVLLAALTACAHTAPPIQWPPDPRVAMPDGRLRTAALVCASRGYAYVARTGPRSAYCLFVNLDNEPEAVLVSTLILERAP
jgi:predicted small lipoprotein YifL